MTPRGRARGGRGGKTTITGQHMSPPEHKATEYPEGMISDLNAAAAAAAATAIMTTAGLNPAGDLNDAEADAEMEDDDQTTGLHTQDHEHAAHTNHLDLNTAANILANGGNGTLTNGNGLQPDNQQHHQQQQMQAHQQQPQHHQTVSMGDPTQHLDANTHGLDPNFVRTTEELARDSGYGTLNVESALAKRLAREPGLRLAQQRRPEQQLNLARRSNVEALFAHIAGDLAPSACKNCHKGHGPWTSCVVVDGQMCGSCANCWFNASGARCSFHETRNPQGAHHSSILSATGTSVTPTDATAYAMGQHHPGANAHIPLPPAATATHPTLVSLGVGSTDPVVKYTVDRAMAEVRNADRKTRKIMSIEIAAKQLALQILEYEEMAMVPNHGQPQQPPQPQHVSQQQQGLGGGDAAS